MTGLSMGGHIAQLLAARHAQRVDKLVLLSTTADHRPYMAATTGEETAMQDAFLSPPAASFNASIAETASRTPGSREEVEQIALAVWRSIYACDVSAEGSGHAFPADFILDCLRKARSCGHDQAAAFNHAAGAQLRVLAMGHMFSPEMSGEIAGLVAAFIGREMTLRLRSRPSVR